MDKSSVPADGVSALDVGAFFALAALLPGFGTSHHPHQNVGRTFPRKTMLTGLVAFLIFALIVLVVAYVIIYVVDMIPGLPAPAPVMVKLIVGVISLILILTKALPLLGINGVL